jgi:hypothetical protein
LNLAQAALEYSVQAESNTPRDGKAVAPAQCAK